MLNAELSDSGGYWSLNDTGSNDVLTVSRTVSGGSVALELTLDSAQPTNGPVPITVEQGDATHYPGEYSQPQSYEVMIIAISGGLTVSLAANSVLDLQSAYVPVTFTSNGGGDQVFLGSNAPTATGSTLTGIDECCHDHQH